MTLFRDPEFLHKNNKVVVQSYRRSTQLHALLGLFCTHCQISHGPRTRWSIVGEKITGERTPESNSACVLFYSFEKKKGSKGRASVPLRHLHRSAAADREENSLSPHRVSSSGCCQTHSEKYGWGSEHLVTHGTWDQKWDSTTCDAGGQGIDVGINMLSPST